jgi:hypothetical protein
MVAGVPCIAGHATAGHIAIAIEEEVCCAPGRKGQVDGTPTCGKRREGGAFKEDLTTFPCVAISNFVVEVR